MSETDLELLKRYACDHAEDAFAEIVRRHLNLAYSAALRQVRSAQLAEEVAQAAFLDLARNAARLKPDTILTAWLYEVARRTAIDVVRREARRQLREQVASEMTAMNAVATDWTEIEPLLDEAMHALDDTDRTAVLLRYFENKSLREVGQALGTSDDTAQKRVSRAVERLRDFFTQRGVTVGASGLVVLISANAVHAAPAGLVASISTAVLLAGTSLAATAAHATVLTTLQKALITATLAVAVGAGIYPLLRKENQELAGRQQTHGSDPRSPAQAAADDTPWTNLGMETPDKSFLKFVWAARGGDSNLVSQMLWWLKDDAVSEELAGQIARAQTRSALKTFSTLATCRILAQRPEPPDRTRVRIEFGDDSGTIYVREVYMIREAGMWKPAVRISSRPGSSAFSAQLLLLPSPELGPVN